MGYGDTLSNDTTGKYQKIGCTKNVLVHISKNGTNLIL